MKESEQKAAAKKFAETWKNRGYEKGEMHSFWIELLQTVYELNRKNGMTVIMITQYMEEAVMADRVVVMNGGQIVMDDVPQAIFSRGDELRALGLDVPEIVRIREDLARQGMPLSPSVLTDEQLAEALCPLL